MGGLRIEFDDAERKGDYLASIKKSGNRVNLSGRCRICPTGHGLRPLGFTVIERTSGMIQREKRRLIDIGNRVCFRHLNQKGDDMRKDGRAMAVWLDHDTASKIERIAKKIGITNSQLMKNLLICGVEDAELLDKMGMLTLAMLIKQAKERMGTLAEQGRRQLEA